MANKSIHNPELDSPIDTVVDGVQYLIDGGDTVHKVPEHHAKNLLERYGFLQEVEAPASEDSEAEDKPKKPVSKSEGKRIAAQKKADEEAKAEEEDTGENSEENTEDGADGDKEPGTTTDEIDEDGAEEEQEEKTGAPKPANKVGKSPAKPKKVTPKKK